jgi:invasion protein IalB
MVCAEAACRLATRFLCILVAVGLPAVSAAPDDANASELIYSTWDRFCFLDNLCFVGSGVRLATKCDPFVAGVALMERTGESKKTLRVTVRNDVRFEDGVRIRIDGEQTVSQPFEKCFPSSCMADYDAGAELVDQLKHGTMLVIEATSAAGAPLTYRLPLGGFAQAYDGPPREPMVFEQQSGRLEKELQERAEGKQSPQEKKKLECEAEHG